MAPPGLSNSAANSKSRAERNGFSAEPAEFLCPEGDGCSEPRWKSRRVSRTAFPLQVNSFPKVWVMLERLFTARCCVEEEVTGVQVLEVQ